jgi:hypothetical protein
MTADSKGVRPGLESKFHSTLEYARPIRVEGGWARRECSAFYGRIHVYLRSPEGKIVTVEPGGSIFTFPAGINDLGTVAG